MMNSWTYIVGDSDFACDSHLGIPVDRACMVKSGTTQPVCLFLTYKVPQILMSNTLVRKDHQLLVRGYSLTD